MSRTVDYRSVIGRLTDAIKELNRPHAKDPEESAKRVAEERRRDATKLLRALLRALEQKPVASGAAGAAAAAAAAAAERSAGALRGSQALTQEQQQSLAFWAWVEEVETNGPPDQAEFYKLAESRGFDKTHAKTLYSIFYTSDGTGERCVVNRADLLYSVRGLLSARATSPAIDAAVDDVDDVDDAALDDAPGDSPRSKKSRSSSGRSSSGSDSDSD